MNSKDLCLIEEVDKLIEAGIDSFKIEGRMKTPFYVATVIRSYRQVIDSYYEGTYSKEVSKKYFDEISKASHRYFTKGFFYKKTDENDQIYTSSSYIRNYDFIGVVKDYDKESKIATIEQRNRFFKGDQIEIFGNSKDFYTLIIDYMEDEKGQEVEVANIPKQLIKIKVDFPLEEGDILRKEIRD